MKFFEKLFSGETPQRGGSPKPPRGTEPIPQPGRLYWAFDHRPLEIATQHFMVTGSTGSGKTTVIRLLMKSIIPDISAKSRNKRAIIYDGKREYISWIYQLKPQTEVVILNPFDSRTYAWDISADVTAPRHAHSIASILIPEEPNSQQRFFPDAARFLLAIVMIAFARKKLDDDKTWSLRDVIVTLRSADHIKRVVASYPIIEDMARPYLDDAKVLPAIMSTLATKLNPFEVVAALWEKAAKEKAPEEKGRVISLREWLDSNKILVMGSSPANRASLDPINQVLFRRLADLLLDSDNSTEGITWLFLDEVREAGKLDGLSSLLNQGRSKGVSVVLGFQEIEGMEQVYGEKIAGEIFGQCAYKTFLRTNSQRTGSWIEGHFGQVQQIEASRSYSAPVTNESNPNSISTSYQRQLRPRLLASMVMSLPQTGPRSGRIMSYNDIQADAIEEVTFSWDTIESLLKSNAVENSPDQAIQKLEHSNECKWAGLTFEEELIRGWEGSDDKRFPAPLPKRDYGA